MTNRRDSRALLISVGVVALLAGCATMQPLQTPSGAAGFSGPPFGTLSIQRPSGTGPFPAVVLLHTCAGLDRSPQVYDWAPRLTSAGYVAAVVDSFSARGVGFNCGVWKVSVDQVADDALAALAHLRTLPFVDKDRISVMGFSYGAMAGLRMASASYMRRRNMVGFQAVVAFYPYCAGSHPDPSVNDRLNNLYDDVSTPMLILIGSDDDETPAAACAEKAKVLQSGGQPISVKVYPGATHRFDVFSVRPVIGTYGGRSHVYRYDAAATADAEKETKAFLARYLQQGR